MKISRIKFVVLFIVSGFTFLFLYNTIVRLDVRGMPGSGAAFFGTEGLIGWRRIVALVLYPIKIVLLGPMLPLINLPDPPPPFVGLGVAFYWTLLGLVIYYLIGKIKRV